MRIRWRKFERSMRPLLRDYDARRRMTLWQRFVQWSAHETTISGAILIGLGAATSVGIIIALWQTIEPNNSAWLNVLSVLGLITATARAGIVQQIAAINRQYLTLWFLPLAASEIFRIILQRMLVSLGILFSLFALVYGPMSFHGGISLASGLLCALLQTFVSLALSGWLIALKIPPNGHGAFAMFLVIFSVWVASDPSIGPTAQLAASILNPAAWVNTFYVETFVKHTPGGLKWLAASLGLIATIPATVLRFRKLHEAGEFRKKVIYRRGRYVIEPETTTSQQEPGKPITAAELSVELQPLNWNSFGFIERVIAQILKPREKVIAQTLLAGAPAWSSAFRRLIFWFALFLIFNGLTNAEKLARFANGASTDRREFWIAVAVVTGGFGAFMATFVMATRLLIWFLWPDQPLFTGVRKGLPATFRMFPFSYWDATLVIAKVNTIIALLLIPIAVLFTLCPAWLFLKEIFHANIWIVSIIAMPWSASFLLPATRFTPSLEDGLKYWPGVIRDSPVYICLALAAFAAIGAPQFRIAFVAAFIGGSLAWFRYIGKRYNRGRY